MKILDLRERLFDVLVGTVDDEIVDIALAALDGDQEFESALGGGTVERPDSGNEQDETPPAGAFLKSLSVEGFRGIGASTRVAFHPGPGLTIVAGRNGSGKSSLAEALEFALTSRTHRWHNAQFAEVWRNLHHGDPSGIRIELAQEGVGTSVISVSWPKDAEDTAQAKITYQPQGGKQQSGLSALGWAAPLEVYRPILSYEELGRMLGGTHSQLYDALAKVLGLEELTAALARVKTRLAPLSKPAREANARRQNLRRRAGRVADHRAQQAASLLARIRPDVAALRALVIGGAGQSPATEALQAILAVELPAADIVTALATGLRHASSELAALTDHASELEDRRRSLLREALRLHESAGDQTCPVCQQGTLDGHWRQRTNEVLVQSDLLSDQRQQAASRLAELRARAQQLLETRPEALDQNAVALRSSQAASTAWGAWSAAPHDDAGLAAHLEAGLPVLAAVVETWQREAGQHASALLDVWAPLATDLAAWVSEYEAALADEAQAKRLETVQQALLHAEKALKAERFEPIQEHAKQIWGRLRQESNVELHRIELTGQTTRRRVEIRAAVDGEDAGALAVMSQGELHALALALFLPRAAMAESPFRFIVLDDPVQAMDPAKVDGLVAVLTELAATHQVIVLSHDDRLAQAARRLPQPPRILEVTRAADSKVSINASLNPAKRYLDDAFALCQDEGVPEQTRRLILPAVLRQALEAASFQRVYATRLASGASLHDVEAEWGKAQKTYPRVALALGSRPIEQWRAHKPARARALGLCSSGVHQGLQGNLKEAVRDVEQTVRDLERGLP